MSDHNSRSSAVIIGGGPAGLMAAEQLLAAGVPVDLYDAMPSVGRKFLLAGIGGLNITHSEAKPAFLARYRADDTVITAIDQFDADALQAWIHDLGIATFIGSSGRVFPVEMKAAPLLRAWLKRLKADGLRIHTRHRCVNLSTTPTQGFRATFNTPDGEMVRESTIMVLAMGGASWPQLGSDGAWTQWDIARTMSISPFSASNCGFDCHWSPFMRAAGQPLKSVRLKINQQDWSGKGECVLTQTGLEGSLIYANSRNIRSALSHGPTTLTFDLFPDLNATALCARIQQAGKAKRNLSAQWAKAGIEGAKADLLREVVAKATWHDAQMIAQLAKALPVTVYQSRPIAEAISSDGGVVLSDLDNNFQSKQYPGLFFSGELLDWDAPTGGYLLTACLAIGRMAGRAAASYWHTRSSE